MRKLLLILPLLLATPLFGQQGMGAAQCVEIATIKCADQSGLADWSLDVNAAFTRLGSTVGIVDARGFTTAQVMSVNISIPTNDVLLFPGVTITRGTGIQFIVTHGVKARGIGKGSDLAGGITKIGSGGSDASAVFVQTPNNGAVLDVAISDMYIYGGLGLGLGLVEPQYSRFSNLQIETGGTTAIDFGEVAGGCACYNIFDNVFGFATGAASTGVMISSIATGGATQNQFIGGGFRGTNYAVQLLGGGANSFYSPDVESCCAVAGFNFGTNTVQNLVVQPYFEAVSSNVFALFSSGTTQNIIIGGNSVAQNSTNNSGNSSNVILSPTTTALYMSGANLHLASMAGDTVGGNLTLTDRLNGLQVNTGGNGTGDPSNIAIGSSSSAGGALGGGGQDEIAIGPGALNLTTGNYNIGVGSSACANNVGGTENICIGLNTGPTTASLSNTIDLGFGATSSANNEAVIGNSSTTDVYLGSETPASAVHATKLISTIATGTAPFVVTSTTPVANLTLTGQPKPVASTTAVTSSNPTINTDQNLIQISLPAGFLNTLSEPFEIAGSGIYSSTAASSPAITIKAKLCTVSGCGSGTVVPLFNIVTSALNATALTNATWNITGTCVTNATGATGNLVCHGSPGLALDTGAALSTPDSLFADTNTATLANIDLTAALFVQFTVAQSVVGASNSYTQQLASIR